MGLNQKKSITFYPKKLPRKKYTIYHNMFKHNLNLKTQYY